MFIKLLLPWLFVIYASATLNEYKYKGLVLLQSENEIASRKAINLTLAGQVEFRRFLSDALANCRNAFKISVGSNCPRKAFLNHFTHVCCNEDSRFLYLNINDVKLNKQGANTFLNLLNTRIDDSFEFTSETDPQNEMILIFNVLYNGVPTLIRTFEETEYPKIQKLLYRYSELCMLENTQATESEACPRVYTSEGVKFCCDYSDQLLYVRLGRMTVPRNDVDMLVNAMRRIMSG